LALSHVGATPPADPHRAEVFTTASFVVTTLAATGRPSGFELQVYRLDGIQQLERALWVDLPGDPESVQRIALARLKQVDPPATKELQQAAVGLTRAVEYGIDRYPAIVFDGTAVVYGVSDMAEALHYYRRWQAAEGS
jgi:integrating conjugative element protein (TIGR03757 family)